MTVDIVDFKVYLSHGSILVLPLVIYNPRPMEMSFRQGLLGFLGITVGTVALPEVLRWGRWTARKPKLFQMARAAADARKKPMLLVGRPWSMSGLWAHD